MRVAPKYGNINRQCYKKKKGDQSFPKSFFCYFAPMHANVQTRFNPVTGNKAPYYRLKESYRDVAGHVHLLILLNIGFEPSFTAGYVRKIAFVLTERFKNRDTNKICTIQKTKICRTQSPQPGLSKCDNSEIIR